MIIAERLTQEERNALAADILMQCERAKLPKLPMGHEEICRIWRSSKHPKKQIQILADMNLCQKSDIIEVLRAYRRDGDPVIEEKANKTNNGLAESTKQRIVRDFGCGVSVTEISRRYMVARNTVYSVIARLC